MLNLMWLQGVVETLLQNLRDWLVKNGEADDSEKPMIFKGFTGQTLVSGSKVQWKFTVEDPESWLLDTFVVTMDLQDGTVWLCTEHNTLLGGTALMLDAVKLRK